MANARWSSKRRGPTRNRLCPSEESRSMGTLLDTLARHLRYAFRTLRRSPTFAAASLLTLALGIGATTAVFSVVNGVLLNPLRYPEPETLVGVLTRAPGAPGANGVGDLPESASMFVTFTDQN